MKESVQVLRRKPMVAQVRGSEAWKAWAEEFARAENRSLASLIERSMSVYAAQVKFPKQPPPR